MLGSEKCILISTLRIIVFEEKGKKNDCFEINEAHRPEKKFCMMQRQEEKRNIHVEIVGVLCPCALPLLNKLSNEEGRVMEPAFGLSGG